MSDMSIGILLGWAAFTLGRMFWRGWRGWRRGR
mgnify:FL=1